MKTKNVSKITAIATAICAMFFSSSLAEDDPYSKYYFKDSKKPDFETTLTSGESSVILVRNLKEKTNNFSTWVNLLAGDEAQDHEMIFKILDISSKRYEVVAPPLDEDTSDDLKEEYRREIDELREKYDFKGSEFSLEFKYLSGHGTKWRGGYSRGAGDVFSNEVPEEKIGEIVTSENGSIKVVTIPLVKEMYDFQILIGDTEEIKELFTKNEWEIPKHQGNLTLYRE